MMNLTKLLDGIEAVQRLATVILYVGVILVVSFQVLNRFWLNLPIVWTSDLSVILFIWLGFVTASTAVRHKGHFRMSGLIDLAGTGALRRSLEILALLVGLIVSAMLLIEGGKMAIAGMREISPGLRLPMVWAYAAVPISGATMILFGIEQIVATLRGAPLHDEMTEQMAEHLPDRPEILASQKGDF